MSSDKADTPIAGDERIHLVTIDWARGKWSRVPGKYSREHLWQFAGKLRLIYGLPLRCKSVFASGSRIGLRTIYPASVASVEAGPDDNSLAGAS